MVSVQTILKGLHDVVNFSDLCRLCGRKKSSAISLFDASYPTSFHNMINFHFQDIQVSQDDSLPVKLCGDCAKLILSWHRFYNTCVQINEALLSVIDKFQIKSSAVEPNTGSRCDIEVIEVDVENVSHDLDSYDILDNVGQPSDKLPENDVETMIVDEINPAEDTTESNTLYDNDSTNVLLSTTKYVTGSVTISSQNLLSNQQTSRADEFLVDVAELSGNSTKSETAIETQDEIVVLFPEPETESLLKGFILNDSTSQHHCSSCFKAHVTKEELLKHICVEHETNISRSEMYECDMCPQLFVKNIHRNTHRFNMHNISIPLHKNYKVVRTDNRTTLNPVELNDENSFYCNYCNTKFHRIGKLKMHKTSKHGVIYKNMIRCCICSMVLLNKRALRVHIKTAHSRVPNEDSKTKITISEEYLQFLSKRIIYDGEIRYFQCEECVFKCRGLNQFIRHGKRHANANPTCAYCDKTFAAKGLLQRHIASVHFGVKKFECNVCGKMFGEKRHMEEHMNLHQETCNFICEVCGKQFKQRQTLAVHKQVHRGEKSFPCEYCDRMFTFKSKLSNHMRKHTGKNLSICQICGKTFLSSTHLKVHMVSHSDVKPFSCLVCSKNFKIDRSLKQHMVLCHGSKRNVQRSCIETEKEA